jgi:bacteriocin resistance YdeI/OmpD-like protein/uncharacterized protein DUF1905
MSAIQADGTPLGGPTSGPVGGVAAGLDGGARRYARSPFSAFQPGADGRFLIGPGPRERLVHMRFRTTLLAAGKTVTGIEIPPGIVEDMGAGKRPPVRVTINGYTYRSTVAVMGGVYMVGVAAEHRAAAGIEAGEEIDVDLVLDTEPRTVEVPDDFAAALDAAPAARARFDRMSYTHQKEHVRAIMEAKKPETRERRISKAIEALSGPG